MTEIVEDKKFQYDKENEWKCYSKKAMKKLYPEGGYKVIGEVISKKGKETENYLTHSNGSQLYIQPLGTYKKLIYRKYGFIRSEDDSFVIVKKNNLLFLLLYLLLLLLLIGGSIWGIRSILNHPDLDPNAKAYEANLERPADWDDSKILIPAYSDLKMYANTDELYVALFNPEKNPCYFKFSLVLDETGETLFETGLVPPGSAVTTVKLPRKFSAGTYPITIRIRSYQLDDYEKEVNGGEVKTDIIALE